MASLSAVAEDVDLLSMLLLLVIIGAMAWSPGAGSVETDVPPPRIAFVSALSFMGTGISSSELSFKVEKASGCDWDCISGVASLVARPDGPGLDPARANCGLEGGRLTAWRAEVLRPSDVNWLPWPIGVGDAVAMAAVAAAAAFIRSTGFKGLQCGWENIVLCLYG